MEKSDFWGVAVNGKPIYKGDCLKWGLGQFADLRGGGAWQERGGGFSRESWYPNAQYVLEGYM